MAENSLPTRSRPLMMATVTAALIPTVLSAQGMVLVGHDALGLPLTAAIGLASFLELALLVSALSAREATLKGRSARTDLTATWAFSLLSGCLSALHEVISDAGTDPRHLLAATVRIVAPLVACWLWHRIVSADAETAAGRTMRELQRDRALLAVAISAHEMSDQADLKPRQARNYRRQCARLLHRYPDLKAAAVRTAAEELVEMDAIPTLLNHSPAQPLEDPAQPLADSEERQGKRTDVKVPEGTSEPPTSAMPNDREPEPMTHLRVLPTPTERASMAPEGDRINAEETPLIQDVVMDLLTQIPDATSTDVMAAMADREQPVSERTARRWLARVRDDRREMTA